MQRPPVCPLPHRVLDSIFRPGRQAQPPLPSRPPPARMGAPQASPQPPPARLSTPLWLLKHTQGITTTAVALAILHLRTTHVVYYTLGIFSTSFSAKGLKRLIKQPRPPGSRVKKTSGMPSTHSASVSFMGSYLLFCLASQPQPEAWTTTAALATLYVGLPVAVMWSRVRLGVHTPAQTVAGAALGVVKAGLWFTAWYGVSDVLGWKVEGSGGFWTDLIGPGVGRTVGVPLDAWINRWERRLLGITA
ncbi:hypothetical protein ACQY0O_007529 [Thecaphora frezii]